MENIILIETSTELCSTAIACDGKIISSRESGTPRAHASLTAVFIDEMLRETGLGIKDCCAVCVSMGPGSYTGLRVGVSTAKGLCFGGALLVLYAVLLSLMGLESPDLGPAWEILLLWLAGTGTLALYDLALTRLAPRLSRRLRHLLPRL